MKHFYFTYDSDEDDCGAEFPVTSRITSEFKVHDDATWDVVLKEFLKFLGAAWGYDLLDKVSYETLHDKLDRLRRDGVILDDDEPWDDEIKNGLTD